MRRLFLGLLLGAVVLAFAPARTVSAHASLENSLPAANSVLEEGPANIVLDFDESIEAGLTSIQLFDQSGTEIPTGAPTQVGDASVVQVSAPALDDGTYAVVWRVASADGHVVNGAFGFQIGTGGGVDSGDLIDQVSGGASAAPLVGRLFTVARFLAFLGFVVLIGAGFYASTAADARGGAASTRALLWLGAIWLFVGTAASFGLYGARAVAGTLTDAVSPSVWGKIMHTQTGQMMLLRLAFAACLGVLMLLFARRGAGWWKGAAIAAAAGCTVTFSAAGHAKVVTPSSLWVAVDAVHLVAVALWIGGLLLLGFGGTAWLTEPDGEPTVRRFSAVATVAVPVIVFTGVAQALKLAGGLDDITATSWGRTLLAKVVVATVLVALGGVARWLLHHDGPSSLRRSIVVEAVLGIAVVGLAAGLVALPPQEASASNPFNTSLTEAGTIVDVSLSPGHVGANEVHVIVTPPGGSLQPVTALTARMSQPSLGIPASPVSLTAIGSNHYSGSITLSAAGDWTLEIFVETTPGQTTLLTTTVPIPG